MKTNRHSLLAKGILVLLSLLIMVFVFTYTWFLPPDVPVSATGMSVTTRDATTDFDYAIGFSNSQTGGAYKYTEFTNAVNADLDLEALYADGDTHDDAHKVNLLYDYNPTDLTGNGSTLIRPAMSYGNWSINAASRNYSYAEENVQYITFDMIFRTKVPDTTIRLDADSFAKGACESYAGDGSLSPSNTRTSKYGNFSADAIVGAVRVAFLEYVDHQESGDTIVGTKLTEYKTNPLLVWIPRPDIYLNNNPGGNNLREKQVDGWALDQNVASNTTYTLVSDSQNNASYSTYVHQYYNVFEVGQNVTPSIVTYTPAVASTLNTNAPANTNIVTLGTARDLIKLDHINDANNDNLPDDQYYYGKVRVRIWIEGTDSESRRALAGGKFSVGFHITG